MLLDLFAGLGDGRLALFLGEPRTAFVFFDAAKPKPHPASRTIAFHEKCKSESASRVLPTS